MTRLGERYIFGCSGCSLASRGASKIWERPRSYARRLQTCWTFTASFSFASLGHEGDRLLQIGTADNPLKMNRRGGRAMQVIRSHACCLCSGVSKVAFPTAAMQRQLSEFHSPVRVCIQVRRSPIPSLNSRYSFSSPSASTSRQT